MNSVLKLRGQLKKMVIRFLLAFVFIFLFSAAHVALAQGSDDPYIWLEEVEGKKSLDQVRAWNKATVSDLQSDPRYQALYKEAFDILVSKERIPHGKIRGENIYNFWQDNVHIRGIWRRTSLNSYLSGAPEWEILLDLDQLDKNEKQNWVYKGVDCLPGEDLCMVSLSRGGTDASVRREFSLLKKSFVEDGFVVPQSKGNLTWLDRDRLLVVTNWGEGSLTSSGYPRIAKIWRRGTRLKDATSIYEASSDDVLVGARTFHHSEKAYTFLVRAKTFYESEFYLLNAKGELKQLPIPGKSDLDGVLNGQLILSLNEDWRWQRSTFPQGAVVALDLESLQAEQVYEPGASEAVRQVAVGKSQLFLSVLENVSGKIKRLKPAKSAPRKKRKEWRSSTVDLPNNGVVSIATASSDRDDMIALYQSLTVPNSLYYLKENQNQPIRFMSLPPMYEASEVRVEQYFTESVDGTPIPYFVMGKKDILAKGKAPTIQYGYGGFQIPILPTYYSDSARPQHGALAGKSWVSRGGVLVLSNIRGGGEYGPAWHQSVLKEKRQLAYDDFFAIGEDLVKRGITTPEKLGAMGRSNGGLLMGVVLTQRPDLYQAIDIGVPLFDMIRYNKLLAGASWMAEYGNPDIPSERKYILQYSPYQNLQKGKDYPKVFFYTSTKDDRVHPGHARKAAARLREYGYDFYYYENTEGGHGGTANQEQLAIRTALEFVYFFRQLFNEK